MNAFLSVLNTKLIQVLLFENMRKLESITKLTPLGKYVFYAFNLHKKGRKKEEKGKEKIYIYILIYFVRCLTLQPTTVENKESRYY